jgi:hypothetical protein
MWQERAGTLADRLTVAESKLLALEAQKSSLEDPGATIAPNPTTGGTHALARIIHRLQATRLRGQTCLRPTISSR